MKLPIIFASALFDELGCKVWSNPDLVDDEVDELVVFTNENWLLFLGRIATLERENAELRLHIQESADEQHLLSVFAAAAGDRRMSSHAEQQQKKHLAALQPKEPT